MTLTEYQTLIVYSIASAFLLGMTVSFLLAIFRK